MPRSYPGLPVIAATAALALVGILIPIPASAYWNAQSTAGSAGATSLATVARGATPLVSVAAKNNVTVSWAATTLSNGVAVAGYTVTRFSPLDVAQTTLPGCAGLITATSCIESSVPDGLWTYRIVPRFAANWSGAASLPSLQVRSDVTAPVNVISRTIVSGGSSLTVSSPTVSTLHFRGVVAGSFRLTNTLSDAGSGPASSATGTLGAGAGWTHTPSSVSTPVGGPYASNPFQWTAGTTSEPSVVITGSDLVGNTALSTIQFRLDNTGPIGGAVSYADGYTTATSVPVTVQIISDAGAGISPGGTRNLQRATAPLTGNTCGAFTAFANHIADPAQAPATQAATITAGTCYRYRYQVTDNVGNTTITTSPNTVRARDYQTVVANTTGVLSHWRLADIGTVADDRLVANNDGTYFGLPTQNQAGAILGDANAAVVFDGVDDYARVVRQISTNFSIELWFKSTQGRGNSVNWFDGAGLVDGDIAGTANDFGISLMADGRIAAGTGNPNATVLSPTGFNDGLWHHVVMTRTQATGAVQLWVDGVSRGTVTGGTQALTGPASIDFGRTQTATLYFAGSLDEIAMYTAALPVATVQNHNLSGR